MGRFDRRAVSAILLFLTLPALAGARDARPAERDRAAGAGAAHSVATLAAKTACSGCRVLDVDRELITGDIAHYATLLQIGPGEHDRIGLHRVVRERSPWRPVRARQGVLLAHGINVGFDGTFLPGVGIAGVDQANNLPVFLASRDVDVWGIDFRWTLVPGDVTDISFMADWGLDRDAADLRIALAAARVARFLSGSGGGKIDLLGYSRGGRISYTYLNDETRLPPFRRHVGRFVQLDANFKTASPASQQAACDRIEGVQAQIDGGQVADDIAFLAILGQLAQTMPDEPSPILTGFTNRQAALLVGTTPPGGSGTFHIFGGIFENGLPTDLAFTAEGAALDLLASTASFQPLAGFRDLLIVLCDDGRSELDDRLADITVPVLYLGAAGGNHDLGLATLPFLGSSEVSSTIVSLLAPGQELFDVGHGDILAMAQAATLVWQPIFDWVTAE